MRSATRGATSQRSSAASSTCMARCHAHAAHVHLHLHLWTLCTLRAARHDLAIRSAYPPIPFSLPIRAPTHPPRVSRTAISSWRTCCSPRTTAASYATLAWRTPTRAGPMERCRPNALRSRCCAARRAMLHQRSSRASGPTLSLSLSLTLTLTLTPTLAPTRTLTLTTDPDH